MINRITVWERKFWKKIKYEKVLVIEHNHIENGWNFRPKPVANCDYQKKDWKEAIWVKRHSYLKNNGVI